MDSRGAGRRRCNWRLSALGAGLYGLGIPKDSILRYEIAIKNDKFVLLAHGSAEDAILAKKILDRTNQSQWIIINKPTIDL